MRRWGVIMAEGAEKSLRRTQELTAHTHTTTKVPHVGEAHRWATGAAEGGGFSRGQTFRVRGVKAWERTDDSVGDFYPGYLLSKQAWITAVWPL